MERPPNPASASPPDNHKNYDTQAPDLESGGHQQSRNRVNTLGAEEITSKPTFAQRSIRITWAWFSINIATGSLATLLANQPYTFTGLRTIGKILYILNLVLFLSFLSLIIARFVRKPRALSTSLHHPSESFYFGAFWVSVALLLLGMQAYGVPATGDWLVRAMRVLFWIYYACALCVAIFQYHVIFHVEKLTVSDAMPAWVLPAYPFLVSGVLAANIAEKQPQDSAVQILIAGICGQGLGWILAFFIYTVYLTRLINSKMPSASVRPGMFISVGPAGFTCASILTLGKQAKDIIPPDYLGFDSAPVGDIWLALSVPAGLFLWLLAVWFSALSSLSVGRASYKMSFSLSWWSFVFPNAGLALATINIGQAIDSRAFRIGGSVITVLIIPFWILALVGNIRAVWRNDLLYPGKDTGVDDVNWTHETKKQESEDRKTGRRGNRQWTMKMLRERRAQKLHE
ncbi:hypothetical protein NLU13_5882 [Sarocladium strictum]|uniref:Malic acid transport protein n=1 Tax=Sarocladium strictum TaxID=5046 RepID=A0AA39L6R6_SARSR|nr:hypothetical protein NLU13_5882 [Sarocladium strictum]